MTRTPKRPRDPNQLAKMVVDLATGEVGDADRLGPHEGAAAHGRVGGLIGGQARAQALTPRRRSEIAQQAAQPHDTIVSSPADVERAGTVTPARGRIG